jgi:hypothetical protein
MLAEVNTTNLNTWQRYGQACVVCGRVFDLDEHPALAGWFRSAGDGRRMLVKACRTCPGGPVS